MRHSSFRVRVGCVSAAVVVLASLAAVPVRAQGLTYGVKGGVILADLQEDADGEATPFDFRTGLVAGGFLTWPIGARLAIQPEVLFTQKGARLDQGGGTLTQKLDYLDIPVLASFRLTGGAERHISLFAGPAFGIRIRARSHASFNGGGSFEEDVSDDVTSTDLGVVGGVAYQRGRLLFDVRYAMGFSDIDKDRDDDIEIRNRGIAIMAGWRF